LPAVDKGLIGHKFSRKFVLLQGFWNVINFASFRGYGKWNSRRQWLNEWVRCTSGLLGRCLKHSFGIPPGSQAFPNFNEFVNHICHNVLFFPTGCLLQMRAELGL
jgi:hypothetical protein